MARQTLATSDVVAIALQITHALEAAHAAGIVHRDIKPGNIVVSGTGQVKVLDFGLARRFIRDDTDEIVLGGSTIIGRPLGTANYMAPERIQQMPPDPRSDLFSLGVVMYEMATGRLPFAGESPLETVENILEKNPIKVTKLSPSRPIQLERIVHRLLAKSAEDRYSPPKNCAPRSPLFDRASGSVCLNRRFPHHPRPKRLNEGRVTRRKAENGVDVR